MPPVAEPSNPETQPTTEEFVGRHATAYEVYRDVLVLQLY